MSVLSLLGSADPAAFSKFLSDSETPRDTMVRQILDAAVTGLDNNDMGLLKDAVLLFKNCVQLDPGFTPATCAPFLNWFDAVGRADILERDTTSDLLFVWVEEARLRLGYSGSEAYCNLFLIRETILLRLEQWQTEGPCRDTSREFYVFDKFSQTQEEVKRLVRELDGRPASEMEMMELFLALHDAACKCHIYVEEDGHNLISKFMDIVMAAYQLKISRAMRFWIYVTARLIMSRLPVSATSHP